MLKAKLSTKWNVCIDFFRDGQKKKKKKKKKKKMGVGTGWQAGDVTPAENLLSGGKTSS